MNKLIKGSVRNDQFAWNMKHWTCEPPPTKGYCETFL